MSNPIYGLLLAAKGELKRIKLSDKGDRSALTLENLQTIVKKKTPLSELGTYEYGLLKITLFGYKTGKAGTENKHELPPPLDESLYFSDILLIASKKSTTWEKPVTFTVEQYEVFYQKAFGGFENLDEDDDDDDGPEEDDERAEDEEDVEDEEDELSLKLSSVKKKAVEEGIPEDEIAIAEEDEVVEEDDEDDEDEEDEDDEEDDIENDQLDEGVEGAEDVYEEEIIPVKTRSSKKKTTKANLSFIQNTGRAIQQTLLLKTGLQQIDGFRPIPTDSSLKEYTFRTHIKTQIQSMLGSLFSLDEQERLEKSIFENSLLDADSKQVVKNFDNNLFQICYMNSGRRLISNLDPNNYVKNTHLYEKLKQGDLQIEHLATMKAVDLAPSLYTEMRDRMILREQQQLEGNKSIATDMFRCGRCHKREATFYELQTRSADEPMTKFITCVNCGNHWKQ